MLNVHVGLNVTNLENSIEFYNKVFGVDPVKVKKDYAKFLLEQPGLNFTLNQSNQVEGNQVGHFGFQVETEEEVLLHKERLEKEGFFARDEMDTTCCYAVQDKFWVTDPDGNEWEFFYTKVDAEVHSDSASTPITTASTCCND
ncbi:ArsI/CadI family heavy metal resistance metalloenzyme [Pseudalkalibacillus salsuginis]|uniref:ArsI/CadI family heavy metal resistance metalloenzyme n=1 Tax=Pseudalkalibacillus salsuginis TaxID=2910972 RepID=UPI001F480CB6|nr:ArsI/CadI family heavy metal resistance metalloenzyme [Pseudalkalibacillus salsuginis]MCF6409709.1 VOC family protein [Pseudalkalibacillus salsuginis]